MAGWEFFFLHSEGCVLGNSNAIGETGKTGLKLHSQTGGCLVASVDDEADHWQCALREGNPRETVGHAAFTWHLKNIWRTRKW